MTHSDSAGQTFPRLRERKKAKTKRLIQQVALARFAEKGYDATTMEEIAEAAEVSLSTVFRYFPTKAALIVTDIYDDMIAEVYRSQPPELDAIDALTETCLQLIADQERSDAAFVRPRLQAAFAQPSVWTTSLPIFMGMKRQFEELVAERSGRTLPDSMVSTFVLASFGVYLEWILQGKLDNLTPENERAIREAVSWLRSGFPL